MKIVFSLWSSMLAMTALASGPMHTQRKDTMHHTASGHDAGNISSQLLANMTFPQDYISTVGPLINNDTVWTSWEDYEPWRVNGTNATTGGIPLDENGQPTEILVVGMRMGGPMQHVGTRRKQRLYDAIMGALLQACPLERGLLTCSPPSNGATATISNIVYNSGGSEYASNAFLKVTVHHAFHNPRFEGLGQVMYEFAALMYELQAEREENCYYVNFKGSRSTKMCNVGQRLSVGMPSNLGHNNLEALLVMDVEFNGKTNEGDWRCDDTIEKNVHDAFQTLGYAQRVAKSVGFDIKKFEDNEVNCYPSQGNCMQWFEFRGQQCN